MFDGWMGVHKIKSFNIVTVHGWVSICTHPMNPPTTPPPSTTHPMNHPKYMYSDRVTLWMCLMGGWVGVHKIKYFNIVTLYWWVSIYTNHMNPSTIHPHHHPDHHTPHEPSNHPPHHEPSKVYV